MDESSTCFVCGKYLLTNREIILSNYCLVLNSVEDTDIQHALTYCQQNIQRPADPILILITDLFEHGSNQQIRTRAKSLVEAGVQLITLLALNDEGAPSFDHGNAQFLARLGIQVLLVRQMSSRI